MMILCFWPIFIDFQNSLGNPSKDRQRFVDGIILISTPDWFKGLSNLEIVAETPFEYGLRTSNSARLCQTENVQTLISQPNMN